MDSPGPVSCVEDGDIVSLLLVVNMVKLSHEHMPSFCQSGMYFAPIKPVSAHAREPFAATTPERKIHLQRITQLVAMDVGLNFGKTNAIAIKNAEFVGKWFGWH